MSFQAMAWATEQKVGNATGKAILLMLANYADEAGSCFPSQKRLSEQCECSVATAQRWVKSLEEDGFLVREKRYGEGGYRRSDRLVLDLKNLRSTELHIREFHNSDDILTYHSDRAEPIREPSVKDVTNVTSKKPHEITPMENLQKVLSRERASDVVAHRKAIRKPLTARAAELLAKKFAKTPDPNAAADQMIANGWQGFEPEWIENRQQQRSPMNGSTRITAADEATRRLKELENADASGITDDNQNALILISKHPQRTGQGSR